MQVYSLPIEKHTQDRALTKVLDIDFVHFHQAFLVNMLPIKSSSLTTKKKRTYPIDLFSLMKSKLFIFY